MTTLLYFYTFIMGLLLGSFYNVVGLRVPLKQSILRPPSLCTTCQKQLTAWELISVFSYLWLRGKCRGCGSKISTIYPMIEMSTAFLFTITPWLVGWSKELLVAWLLISLLVIIFVSDIHYKLIPDKVLLFFAIVFIGVRLFLPMDPWWNPLLGAFLGFSLLLFIAIVSKGGMGGGDIKLFAVLGLVLGWKGILLAFFFSTLYGAVFGVMGIILKKVARGQPIPFGPFIALGSLTAYFFAERLLASYLHLL